MEIIHHRFITVTKPWYITSINEIHIVHLLKQNKNATAHKMVNKSTRPRIIAPNDVLGRTTRNIFMSRRFDDIASGIMRGFATVIAPPMIPRINNPTRKMISFLLTRQCTPIPLEKIYIPRLNLTTMYIYVLYNFITCAKNKA